MIYLMVCARGMFVNWKSTSYETYSSSSFKDWSLIRDANSYISDILNWLLHRGFRYSAITFAAL